MALRQDPDLYSENETATLILPALSLQDLSHLYQPMIRTLRHNTQVYKSYTLEMTQEQDVEDDTKEEDNTELEEYYLAKTEDTETLAPSSKKVSKSGSRTVQLLTLTSSVSQSTTRS